MAKIQITSEHYEVIRNYNGRFPSELCEVIRKMFNLVVNASRDGGVWLSAGYGSMNVAAGVVSRIMGYDYSVVQDAISAIGADLFDVEGGDWYIELASMQPGGFHDSINYEHRWCIDNIAEAACELS